MLLRIVAAVAMLRPQLPLLDLVLIFTAKVFYVLYFASQVLLRVAHHVVLFERCDAFLSKVAIGKFRIYVFVTPISYPISYLPCDFLHCADPVVAVRYKEPLRDETTVEHDECLFLTGEDDVHHANGNGLPKTKTVMEVCKCIRS